MQGSVLAGSGNSDRSVKSILTLSEGGGHGLEGSPRLIPPVVCILCLPLCLAQGHMSLRTESLRGQGGIVPGVPHNHYLCLSPAPTPDLFSAVEASCGIHPTTQPNEKCSLLAGVAAPQQTGSGEWVNLSTEGEQCD